jgi:preprotein translocase subunit SecD
MIALSEDKPLKNISWRVILVIVVTISAIVYILPSFKPGIWPNKQINLGLDLQGGMHLVLEVKIDEAVENTIERISQELNDVTRKKRIHLKSPVNRDKDKIILQVKGKTDIEEFYQLMDKEFMDLRFASRSETNETLNITLDLPPDEVKNIKKLAIEQARETIRNRIDQFGVSEPDIRIQGEDRILIQLPGLKDPQRAKDLIGKTALLEFKLVDDANDLDAALKGQVPAGSEILYQVKEDPDTRRTSRTPYLIKKRASMTGAYITDARVNVDQQFNEPFVSMTFDKKGARLFERITEENEKKRLAIILDNNVYSAPMIQEKISGGEARITGNFSDDEARDLAIALRAGALPAPVEIIEERTVGPSLGTDSIRMGLISMTIGGVIVILFMMIYYKGAGLVADLALILNILLIAAGLAAFQSTLTLPGIAGIILTIGMAVDANVLIFERIREELRLGKTARSALAAGYDRATLTILDANVTTFIVALVLLQFGTGPVRGFAVTLSLGIVSSLFTALILTRMIFDYYLMNRNVKKISI